jgi:hypothetical protein
MKKSVPNGYFAEKISKKSIISGLDMGNNTGYNAVFREDY